MSNNLNTPLRISDYMPGYEDLVMERLEKKYYVTTTIGIRFITHPDARTPEIFKEYDEFEVRFLITDSPVARDTLKEEIVKALHPWPRGKIIFLEDNSARNYSSIQIITPRSFRHTFDIRIKAATLLEIGLVNNGELFE